MVRNRRRRKVVQTVLPVITFCCILDLPQAVYLLEGNLNHLLDPSYFRVQELSIDYCTGPRR